MTESPNPNLVDADTLSGQLHPVRRVAVGLGGNVGDTLQTLQSAIDALLDTPGVAPVGVSGVFQTRAVGGPAGQRDHLNAVLLVDTALSPARLLDRVHVVEDALGRVRGPDTERDGPRTVDLDILSVGDRVINTAELTVPHPRAHTRGFVLAPWADVDPDAVIPGRGRVADLAAALGPLVGAVDRRPDLTLWLPG